MKIKNNIKNNLEKIMSIVMVALAVAASACLEENSSAIAAGRMEYTNSKTENEKANVVVIDPGHGGIDPGKIGINGELEKDINLTISHMLRDYLEKNGNGIRIVMTREEDEGLYSEADKNKKRVDINNRIKIINDSNVCLCVSIHQNSFSSEKVSGAQTFYYSKSDQGKKLAECIQKSIVTNVLEQNGNKRVEKPNQDYYILRRSDCPTVIVECGFLSNWKEANMLRDKLYQEHMAEAIGKGILQYLLSI